MKKIFVLASALAAGTSAMAAVPQVVTDAVTALGVDAGALATGVLLALIVVYSIKFIRKGL